MNKRLKKILREATSSTVTYAEKFVRQDASIPGLTIDGKDIKSLLDSKDFESFLREDACHISFDETGLSNKVFSEQEKEVIISHFAGYSKDVKEYFNFNLAVIKKLISSINRMIPSDLHKDEIDVADKIKDSVQKMSYAVSLYDDCIQNKLLVLFEQEKETIGARSISAKNHHGFRLMKVMIDLNLLSMRIPLLHQIVYDYFYGPEEEKSEKADMIKQITENVVEQMSLKFTPQFDRIEKNTTQAVNNTKESIELENKIITNQVTDKEENSLEHATIQEEMNKKQRLERTKPLKLTTCLDAIKEVYSDPKYNYPQQFQLHPYAIRNQLSDWNQYLITGGLNGQAPLPKFDFYRHTDKETFKKWVRDVFFPDYRERAHKDVLANASHPKNMNDIPDPTPQDIIDEVDESLASDDHYNPE